MLVGTFWALFDVSYCMTLLKRRACLALCYFKSSPCCINSDRVRCMIIFCKLYILVHANKNILLNVGNLLVCTILEQTCIHILLQNFNKSWWWRFILCVYTCFDFHQINFNYLSEHTISNVKIVLLTLQSFLLINQYIFLYHSKYNCIISHVSHIISSFIASMLSFIYFFAYGYLKRYF